MFLSQLEKDIFSVLPGNTSSCNLTKHEWLAVRGLAEDKSIIIKPADKGSIVVLWDKVDYLAEAENHLSGSSTYKEVKFGEEELVKLVEQSNRMFKQLLSKKIISSEEYRYFTYGFKKSTNLGNMYFLPKKTFQDKKIAKEDLLKMAEFVLKNSFFEFNSKFKQQISGTAIGTKFAPPYACIFMDKVETEFLDK